MGFGDRNVLTEEELVLLGGLGGFLETETVNEVTYGLRVFWGCSFKTHRLLL